MDVNNPRIPNLCKVSPPWAGYGCGHGVCIEDAVLGDYCECEPGYGRSSYWVNVPTCQETVETKLGILFSIGAYSLLFCLINVYLATYARARIKSAALFNATAAFFHFWFNTSVYLEGYLGISGTILGFLATMFMCIAIGYIVLAIYEPTLRATNMTAKIHRHRYLFRCQAFMIPTLMGTYVVAVPFAVSGNWATYNYVGIYWFLGTILAGMLILFLPLQLVIVKFDKFVVHSSNSDTVPSPARIDNRKSNNEKTYSKILRMLVIMRNFILLTFTTAFAIYFFNIISIALYGQIPFQAAFWFVGWQGYNMCCTGVTYFVYSASTRRVISRADPLSEEQSPSSSRQKMAFQSAEITPSSAT